MSTALIAVAVFLSAVTAQAGDYYGTGQTYEIRPKNFDLNPNDGFNDPGSYSNPYQVKDQYGNTVGEIKPKYYDIKPNDRFNDAGSWNNPYQFKVK